MAVEAQRGYVHWLLTVRWEKRDSHLFSLLDTLPRPAHGQGVEAPPQDALDLAQERVGAQRPTGVGAGSHRQHRFLILRLAQACSPIFARRGRAPGPQVEQPVLLPKTAMSQVTRGMAAVYHNVPGASRQ